MGKRHLYSFAIIVLVIASSLFAQRLLTAGYPTHSDVFFLGVEAGVLLSALMVCLVLICWSLYSLFFTKKECQEQYCTHLFCRCARAFVLT